MAPKGFRDLAPLEQIASADIEGYGFWQSTMVFASAAVRDAAISTNVREGMVCYLEDLDQVAVYNGTSWYTVAHMGAWTTYTPTGPVWSGGGGSGGDWTVTAAYARLGRVVHFRAAVVWGSTTVAGTGRIRFGLPFAAAADSSNGGAIVSNSGVDAYGASIFIPISESYVEAFHSSGAVTATNPFTFAVGDAIYMHGTYESVAI